MITVLKPLSHTGQTNTKRTPSEGALHDLLPPDSRPYPQKQAGILASLLGDTHHYSQLCNNRGTK